MLQGLASTFLTDNVVSRHVSMTRVDAGPDGNQPAQTFQNFRHLLEAAPQRKLRAGRILDQNTQAALGQFESLCRCGDGRGRTEQSLLAIGAPEGSGMQHQIIRA